MERLCSVDVEIGWIFRMIFVWMILFDGEIALDDLCFGDFFET
jgi:hypothetical protein